MIACPNCGAQNADESKVCVQCGAPVGNADSVQPDSIPVESAPIPEPLSSPAAPPAQPAFQQPAQPMYQPPAQPAYVQPPQPAYPAQPGYPPPYAYAPRPLKDRSMALILEILPALFGIYGIGWLYSGNTGAGIAWLIGMIAWGFIVVVLAIFTVSISLLCTIPINLVALAVSAISLHNYTKAHPEIFGI